MTYVLYKDTTHNSLRWKNRSAKLTEQRAIDSEQRAIDSEQSAKSKQFFAPKIVLILTQKKVLAQEISFHQTLMPKKTCPWRQSHRKANRPKSSIEKLCIMLADLVEKIFQRRVFFEQKSYFFVFFERSYVFGDSRISS